MEILLNELSLEGQFSNIDDFIENGLKSVLSILKELGEDDVLFKKYQFYQSKITVDKDIQHCLKSNACRTYDEIRRFKSYLDRLIQEPYWEGSPIHPKANEYLFNEQDVFNTSLAEACERDKIVISFKHNNFTSTKLIVTRDKEEINVDNLTQKGEYIELSWNRKNISIDKYCDKKYNGSSKLNFSKIDLKNSFNLLLNDNDKQLYLDTFRKFNSLDWQQIYTDNGLDYKEFHNPKKYFSIFDKEIYKFRVSEKYRCFGYVDDGVFYVLRFDLEHKLSD